jgi:hypothetical protein
MFGLDPTIIAVCFGATAICIVSAVDFHAPHKVVDVRYAVMRDRYYFAIVVYCTIAVMFYLLVLKSLVTFVMYPILGPDSALMVAVPATIALMVLAPHLPPLCEGVDFLRSSMQTLARYPQAVETVTATIARSPIEVTGRAKPELMRELEGYGVPEKLIERALTHDDEVLAAGAATMIQQVASLHTSFADLRNDRRFEKFFLAREEAFDDLDKQYRRMLRRSARALLLTEDISISDHDARELVLEISDFIAEECEALRGACQRRLAEATLSVINSRDARTDLISSFGYLILLPQPLPFAPLVVIFSLDFVVSVAPLFFLSNLPQQYAVTLQAGGLSALAHSAALTISIFFAVYPKASTNFARPSLYGLPWRSYIFFGLASYLVGNAILYLTYRTIDLSPGWAAKSHPLAASSLFSLIFLINTLVLSILLDVRLRAESLDYREARLRDGATHAVVMISLMLIILIGLTGLSAMYGMKMPEIAWWIYTLIVFLFGVLGFVMGYLVPSTAEAYIEANKLMRRSAGLDGNFLGWTTPESRPRATAES